MISFRESFIDFIKDCKKKFCLNCITKFSRIIKLQRWLKVILMKSYEWIIKNERVVIYFWKRCFLLREILIENINFVRYIKSYLMIQWNNSTWKNKSKMWNKIFSFETSFSNKATLKFFHSNSKAEKILNKIKLDKY